MKQEQREKNRLPREKQSARRKPTFEFKIVEKKNLEEKTERNNGRLAAKKRKKSNKLSKFKPNTMIKKNCNYVYKLCLS